jgi:hypothetical protein
MAREETQVKFQRYPQTKNHATRFQWTNTMAETALRSVGD